MSNKNSKNDSKKETSNCDELVSCTKNHIMYLWYNYPFIHFHLKYDMATGTHQGPIENSARQWGNLVRSWKADLHLQGINSVPKSIQILADLAFYKQLNLLPTSFNSGNITPYEFYSGTRPSY